MREILFRGRLKAENGELKKGDWVYGDLVTLIDGKEKHLHIYGKGEVKAETIGQYTGLTDKNGKKIFEGDIIRIIERGETVDGGIVVFENGYPGGWLIKDKTYSSKCSLAMRNDVEIIGNIHDNPEILESEVQGE